MPNPLQLELREEWPDFYTQRDVAEIIGRSKETVIRWRRMGLLKPTHSIQRGSLKIWLYDEKALNRAKKLARTLHTGPKPKALRG
jgi:hypothetical protein